MWFLENVYRLEETDARDVACDHSNDKGIDGIYVDHNNEEIHFLQAKIRQSDTGRIGDVGPKNLMGSVAQFNAADNVKTILSGNADDELKRLIVRVHLADMVAAGYRLVGVYVSNESHNTDSEGYAALTPDLSIFDREEIAARMVEVDTTEGKKGAFTFDTSYVDPLEMKVGAGKDDPVMFVFPARALQLVHMEGIADGSLFRENVRYGLGNTSVNKAIRGALTNKSGHANFILGHNGLIILCASADKSKSGELTIKDYSVVNGARKPDELLQRQIQAHRRPPGAGASYRSPGRRAGSPDHREQQQPERHQAARLPLEPRHPAPSAEGDERRRAGTLTSRSNGARRRR